MYSIIENNIIISIQQNIRLILTTPKGSDIHRPDFGSNLWQFIDQPLTAITKGRIKAEIIDAIETWEPRVEIIEVDLKKEYSSLTVKITFKIKDTEETQSTWIQM